MNLGDTYKVWEIKALKKVGQDQATKILDRIAKQVQPIMRKHKWRVKVLSEFWPQNPALLGLNVGAGVHVKVRLRRPNRECDFLPFDQVLDTMLHELCHNAHGPHNANFYKLWDELRKECEELMTKGISGTGEGFDLLGRRLGGFSRQPPLSSLRQTALAAAEKRASLGSLLPSGPKRVGGDNSIMVALSPIQAAAMASERRLQDNLWCGSEHFDVSGEEEDCAGILQKPINTQESSRNTKLNGGSERHSSDAISRKRRREPNNSAPSQSSNGPLETSFVDLTTPCSTSGSMSGTDQIPQKRSRDISRSFSQSSNGHPNSGLVDLTMHSSTSGSMLHHDAAHNREEFNMWECATCTLLNPRLAPICKLCSAPKPKGVKDKYSVWSCKFCTLENSTELEKCAACGQWRYSHGALPAPNHDT